MRASHQHLTWTYLTPFLGLLAALLLVHGSALYSGAAPGSAPKQLEKADPGDCAACHGPVALLPKDHPATKGQSKKNCAECHDGKKASSLRGKLPLSHVHGLEGVSCADCHGGDAKQAVEMAKCLECHESGEGRGQAHRAPGQDPPQPSPVPSLRHGPGLRPVSPRPCQE